MSNSSMAMCGYHCINYGAIMSTMPQPSQLQCMVREKKYFKNYIYNNMDLFCCKKATMPDESQQLLKLYFIRPSQFR